MTCRTGDQGSPVIAHRVAAAYQQYNLPSGSRMAAVAACACGCGCDLWLTAVPRWRPVAACCDLLRPVAAYCDLLRRWWLAALFQPAPARHALSIYRKNAKEYAASTGTNRKIGETKEDA